MLSELPNQDTVSGKVITYAQLTIFLCSIVLNTIEIVFLFKRKKKNSRKEIDAVMLNVAVSDLLIGVCGTCAWALATVGPSEHYYFIPVGFCRYNSIIAFFLLALDRYLMVKFPFTYHQTRSKIIVMMAMILSWMTAGLLKIIQEIMFTGCPVYATGLIVSFTPIWILLVVLVVLTHRGIRQSRKEVFSKTAYVGSTSSDVSSEADEDKERKESIQMLVQKVRQRQERRDVYTSACAITAFLLLTMPDTILSTVSTFSDALAIEINREASFIAITLLSTRSIITPVIYLYQNMSTK